MIDDINLPPLPVGITEHGIVGHDGLVYADVEMEYYARAAVEADRADHLRDVTKMMPSDEELLRWAGEEEFFLFCDEDEFLQIARALLARYGSALSSNPGTLSSKVAASAPVGEASPMPGASGFTVACFKASDVPSGTKLYVAAQASVPIPPADKQPQPVNTTDELPGEDVAARLDALADAAPWGSLMQSDLYAAATAWRKHISGPTNGQEDQP